MILSFSPVVLAEYITVDIKEKHQKISFRSLGKINGVFNIKTAQFVTEKQGTGL